MKAKEFVKEGKDRLKPGETLPPFFQKLRMIAIYLVTAATVIIGISASGLYIPDQLISICTYVIVGGAFVGITSQFTSVKR